jgi:integrase
MVRLFIETRRGAKRYVVQFGPKGAREQQSWPCTKEGKEEAEGFFKGFGDELRAKKAAAPLTARALWETFLTAEGEHLRPRTRRLYSDAWRQWEQFFGPQSIADAVTIQQIAEFRKALDDRGLATATVRAIITQVRGVYNFGERMELIGRNRWHLWVHKIAKEKRTQPRADYRAEEFLRIWAALNPDGPGQWRAWAIVGLLGIYGNRLNELLQMEWSWIEGDQVHVPAQVVKTGDSRELTLFPLTQQIIDVARRWREKLGYTGPYVLFAGQAEGRAHASQQGFYSIQSFTDTLHRAERRAGVETIRWRAGHGFRRGLVGDLADNSGDIMLALQAIGDRDVKMAPRYRVRRNDRVDAAVQKRAVQLFGEGATKVQPNAETAPESAVSSETNVR